MSEAQYQQSTVTGYLDGGLRGSASYKEKIVEIPITAGKKYKITIDDIHLCAGYAGALQWDGIRVDIYTYDGTTINTSPIKLTCSVAHATGIQYATWPRSNGSIDPYGWDTYLTDDALIGNGDDVPVGGASFEVTTGEVVSDTTLYLKKNPTYQGNILNNDNYCHANARYTVEEIS